MKGARFDAFVAGAAYAQDHSSITDSGCGASIDWPDDVERAADVYEEARLAADKERVRQVVRDACCAVERTAVTAVRIEKLDAIVERAVDELCKETP